jgi:uracil-DNA glycosylase
LCDILGVRPRPRFAHGALAELPGPGDRYLVDSFHVSQQNTFTGKLTPGMLDAVLERARTLSGLTVERRG